MAAGGDYANKPRPCLVIQSDLLFTTDSVIVCLITSDMSRLTSYRMSIEPNNENGLRLLSNLMADKVIAVPRLKLVTLIGKLSIPEMSEVDKLLTFIMNINQQQ